MESGPRGAEPPQNRLGAQQSGAGHASIVKFCVK
jgi:hypothetical protein